MLTKIQVGDQSSCRGNHISFNYKDAIYSMGKLARNLRICGDCGIAYTSVSLTRYIDQCPVCKSRRFESIPIKTSDN